MISQCDYHCVYHRDYHCDYHCDFHNHTSEREWNKMGENELSSWRFTKEHFILIRTMGWQIIQINIQTFKESQTRNGSQMNVKCNYSWSQIENLFIKSSYYFYLKIHFPAKKMKRNYNRNIQRQNGWIFAFQLYLARYLQRDEVTTRMKSGRNGEKK